MALVYCELCDCLHEQTKKRIRVKAWREPHVYDQYNDGFIPISIAWLQPQTLVFRVPEIVANP